MARALSKSMSRRFPAPGHDHEPCLTDTVARAEAAFDRQGVRLTPLRRAVLEEVASSHTAVGAYEVLDRMATRQGRRLAPISIYRALDALVDVGVVHRLESRNAFFACHAAHAGEREQIVLACSRCGTVAEVPGPDLFRSISQAAGRDGFQAQTTLVEVIGLCMACADTSR